MKKFKKSMGLVLCAAMLLSLSVTAFAAPSSTGATGNLLDYAVETVVVPTSLKVTLNPNGYSITTKYVKATTYSATQTYYTDATGATKATVADADAFATGTFYEAVKSNAQVVSFNYGIANKSTAAKKVTVDLAADYTAAADKTAISFVDSAAKAQAYNESTNPDGAKRGELKMYLAVAAASALPTANTYAKTADTSLTTGKTYYTKSSGTFTAVDTPNADNLDTYYEESTVIGTEISASELADVTMTAASTGAQAFAPATHKGDANIAFSLGAATYDLQDGATISFDTAQSALSGLLEMTTLGGVAGFTITGAINPNADWTTAEATAISITPTYTIADADGTETAEGGYNQVSTTPPAPAATAPSIATTTYTYPGDDIVVDVNLGTGDKAATAIISAKWNNIEFLGNTMIWDGTANTLTINDAAGSYISGQGDNTITVVFDDTDSTTVVLTINA